MILRGRAISKGRAEGPTVLLSTPFSFLGGVDARTGSLLAPEEARGADLKGSVFAFPCGEGSIVGSYTMLDMAKKGTLPAAIVNERAEPIVTTGAVMAGIPLVDRISISLLRDGDRAIVDGNSGTVELPEVEGKEVVTCVLRKGDRILILRRSEEVGTFRGRWAGVSGYVEAGEKPLDTAYKEMAEEARVTQAELVTEAEPLLIRSGQVIWTIHAFLFGVKNAQVRTDWEHTEHRWIRPNELRDFDIVPGFERVVSLLLSEKGR